ncbi:hypothetical protein [Actinacidiphila yeochonensis]|uniref:hypothetical protein n=1 Tax=Actinacidiphila yeochonensis TaxID=89050 RepID=UPI00069135C3|nr:hypothetical protein [Actinacidiphila yeochonensis]
MTTLQPARRVAAVRGPRALIQRIDWRHPVAVATVLAAVLHLLWALYLAKDSGDMAAQYAWTEFIRAHPSATYNLSWYGGMHPASYSILSPYIMAILGVRTTGVLAGTLTAGVAALMLTRARIKRPLIPVLWTTLALWGDVVSGRVTFALGMLFALIAAALLYPDERAARGRPSRVVAATALTALATMASPVAGLFMMVVAAVLFLTRRHKEAYLIAAAPPVVIGATSLLFPFYGVQPFKWYFAIIPFAVSVVVGLVVPRTWRAVFIGSWVYALGVVLTFVIPSPIGSNVERLALLFGGTVLLIVAMASTRRTRRSVLLWLSFASAATWQIVTPIVDQVITSSAVASYHAAPLIDELKTLHADLGRVEVVPLRSHWEASGLSPYVNLARGWNRQADVERNALFYDGTLSGATYYKWLRNWGVRYVVLPSAPPDGAAVAEARLVAAGPPGLTEVWQDADWRVFSVKDPLPLAEHPAVVERAGPADLTVRMTSSGSALLRIPWSPVLGIEGSNDSDHGCLAPDGDWTRLYAPAAGTYKIGGSFALIRGTQCDKAQIQSGAGREPAKT